jgi:hypothetical protein
MTNERVEVITSVERRRRWSFAEKRQLVAATAQHLSVSRPETPVAVRTVVVSAETQQCAPVIPPELRDMIGHD